MKKKYLSSAGLIVGSALIAAAIFANQPGPDHNTGWGKGRLALLSAGLLVVALAAFVRFGEKLAAAVPPQVMVGLSGLREWRVSRLLWTYRLESIILRDSVPGGRYSLASPVVYTGRLARVSPCAG
jgi:hypothetical protein